MQRIYCTQFDTQFLTRGIAMLRSLRRFDACAGVQVLALDRQCARIVTDLFGESVHVITTETLAARWPELRELREQRRPWAYYATQKPLGVLHAVERARPLSTIAFLDADTWLFSDPAPMFAEFGEASIGLSPHRYPPDLQRFAATGEYNAGCILWRADQEALRCARDWSRDCLEWCGEELDSRGRYMNQGYLRWWPERYQGVHVLRHPGVNLAPWNVDNYILVSDGAGVSVDGRPLIFFHFSGLVPDGDSWASFHSHRHRQLDVLRECVYGPYLAAVEAEGAGLRRAYNIGDAGNLRSELTIQPGVLRFRAAAAGATTASEAVRREDAEVELARYRRSIRGLVDAGMFEAALSALREAGPPLDGRYAEWDYLVAYCLQALGRERESAVDHYTKALELGFDEFWVRLHRGQLLLGMRRREEARLDLRRAFELRPGHEGIADLLRRIQAAG